MRASRSFARRLLSIGSSRLELLALEAEEGRDQLLQALLWIVALALAGLLAGITLTALLVVAFWQFAVWALLVLTIVYGGATLHVARRLALLLQGWQSLPATRDQLQKDRRALDEMFP